MRTALFFTLWRALRAILAVFFLLSVALAEVRPSTFPAHTSQEQKSETAPLVLKVEPPSWWTNLTPEVMLMLSGHNLEATHANCNLPSVVVERTQSAAGGNYLFLWLKIAKDAKSGTVVCRLTTSTGNASFELPLASRAPGLGRNQGASQQDIIYLIMPDRFANGDPSNDEPAESRGSHERANPRAYHGGDLRGIREHLSYLQDLGVTALWLTPIVKNGAPQDYHGYGAVDLYAVDPHLGTIQDYRELVADAHKQGIKVLFDFVPNHVGPKHPWVDAPPTRDWFHGTPRNHSNSSEAAESARRFYGKANDPTRPYDPFELLVDPHAPPGLSRKLTEGWFFGVLPDLNTENPLVAEYLLQESIWWAETSGVDGFRLDTFPYVSRGFWAAWHAGLHQLYPFLTTTGEVFHPEPSVVSFFQGGVRRYDGIDSGVNTLFDYPMYFALRDVLLHDAPVGRLADVLRQDSLYVHPESLATFFGNHDVPRIASTEGSSLEKAKLAFGLTLTMRGIPQLYYGDEIGMRGAGDPDNRRDFPGGWPGDPKNAFSADGRSSEQQELFGYVQSLLHLRKQHPALQSGKMLHLSSDEMSYVFLRETDEESIVIAFNNSSEPRGLRIPLNDTPAKSAAGLTLLLGQAKADISAGEARIAMPGKSISIFLMD